ncbi:MAG: hypothetical protein HQL43_12070 [Alphaproteobacteria bacterium]|nr:hypothetical protein [Alphaproteobacteria bacterium]
MSTITGPAAIACRTGGKMSLCETETGAVDNPWAMIGRRLKQPCQQYSFYVVLILGIVILGYLAVWIEAWHAWKFTATPTKPDIDLDPLKLAYATAILAVGAPCCMQIALTLNKMAILTGIVLIFLILTITYSLATVNFSHIFVHLLGAPGLLLAILSWWLANGEDELFQDRVKPYAASGGDTTRDLSGGNSGVKI